MEFDEKPIEIAVKQPEIVSKPIAVKETEIVSKPIVKPVQSFTSSALFSSQDRPSALSNYLAFR